MTTTDEKRANETRANETSGPSAAQLKQLMKCCTVVGGYIFKAATKAMNENKKQGNHQQQQQQQPQHQQQQHAVDMSPAPAAQEPMTRPNASFMPTASANTSFIGAGPTQQSQQQSVWQGPAVTAEPVTQQSQQPAWGLAADAQAMNQQPTPQQSAWGGASSNPEAVTNAPASQQSAWGSAKPNSVMAPEPAEQQSAWGGASSDPEVRVDAASQQPAWGSAKPNSVMAPEPAEQQSAWGGASANSDAVTATPVQQQSVWGGTANAAVMAAPVVQQATAWGSTPNAAVMNPSVYAPQAVAAVAATTTYSDAGATANVDVDLATAMSTLWTLDSNRLTPGTDYQLDIQGYTKFHGENDNAHDPLFAHVDSAVQTRPTYATFIALLDNYEAETGKAERTTSHEENEQDAFLDAIMQTGPMQFCHRYLAKGAHAPSATDAFKNKLKTLWFRAYRSTSGRPEDSSGFEHVFVGEVKSGDKDGYEEEEDAVTGMHNWVQLWREEVAHRLDYRGYISHGRGTPTPDQQDHILTLQFAWNGTTKRISTSFVGVSPEFEIALYTMLALAPMDRNVTRKERGKDVTTAEFEGRTVELNLIMWEPSVRTAFPVEPR